MRCENLTRELASPTGAYSPAEMAGHLADCPGCAEWSRQAARFDQIWEATRPAEPSPALMDTLWAQASAALEAPAIPATLQLEGLTTTRRGWLKPSLLLAQAAAILLAVGFVWLRTTKVEPTPVAQTPVADPIKKPAPAPQPTQIAQAPPAPASLFLIEANVDETVVVTIPASDDAKPETRRLTQAWSEKSNQIPPITHQDMMNDVEVMLPTLVYSSR